MQKFTVLLVIFFCVGSAKAQQPVIESSLIFPPQEKHVHGSSIVALPNGDLLAAWFHGSGERTQDDVKIMGARLKKGGKKWSAPFLLADTPDMPDCNPVLFLNKSGKLFLVWIAVQANRWEYSILRLRTSVNYLKPGAPVWNWQDNILLKPGKEFEEEVAARFKELPDDGRGWSEYAPPYDNMVVDASKDLLKRSIGWMTRIKPIVTHSGRILLPLYSDGLNFSLVAISDNDGETWYPSLPIVGRGPIQPALGQRKDGTIAAFMRDSGDEPSRVHYSESKDNGKTWTATRKTEIPNTASVEICVLANGYWAFLGNDINDGRYQLSLYLSDDEGKSWKWKTKIEDHPKDGGGYSYPALIQTKDGLLRMTYSHHAGKGNNSIKYVVVDPLKLVK
ncbi:MAG: exo-alpha-sialidase [Chitinophagaceae bacterium]|nr:exo-alpha-sialidase [Chitinophagaceae bacterium]MCW5929646.1 exo-alpha-sialidase [Chitinophagaceae bacterium]